VAERVAEGDRAAVYDIPTISYNIIQTAHKKDVSTKCTLPQIMSSR
jgi:hypothetical protein